MNNLMQSLQNAMTASDNVNPTAIISAVRNRDKATIEQAIGSLINAIGVVVVKGENHPDSKIATIESLGTIANSDLSDAIRQASVATRQKLDNEREAMAEQARQDMAAEQAHREAEERAARAEQAMEITTIDGIEIIG